MSLRFVELDTIAFENFLATKGFIRTVVHNEVVYVRHHERFRHLMVKVYTTIRDDNRQTRQCGADAIRVAAVFDNETRSFGIGAFPRVFRSAPVDLPETARQQYVFDRVLLRMRMAYKRCTDWQNEQV